MVLLLMLLVGCVNDDLQTETGDTSAMKNCVADEDCIPLPSECHPRECINSNFADKFEVPAVCTEQFDTMAAYTVEDCGCVGTTCVNLKSAKVY